ESPPSLVEQFPVAIHPRGAVGGDRHRADLLLAAVVLADLLGIEGGVGEQLLVPLARKFATRREDQRLAADLGHRADGGDRLPAARRTDEHTRAGVEKAI